MPTFRQILDSPPHIVAEGVPMCAWFVDEHCLALIRVTEARRLDAEMSRWYTDVFAGLARERFGGAAMTWIHDWTLCPGYDMKARTLLTSWAVGNRDLQSRVWVVAPNSGPMLRLGVSTAKLALRKVGTQVEIVDTLDEAIAGAGLED